MLPSIVARSYCHQCLSKQLSIGGWGRRKRRFLSLAGFLFCPYDGLFSFTVQAHCLEGHQMTFELKWRPLHPTTTAANSSSNKLSLVLEPTSWPPHLLKRWKQKWDTKVENIDVDWNGTTKRVADQPGRSDLETDISVTWKVYLIHMSNIWIRPKVVRPSFLAKKI